MVEPLGTVRPCNLAVWEARLAFRSTSCPRTVAAGKRVSHCNVNLFIVFHNCMGAGHSISKHNDHIDIAVTYPFSRNDFPGAERALKTQASLPNIQIARPYRPKG